jgi:hypothetical protein
MVKAMIIEKRMCDMKTEASLISMIFLFVIPLNTRKHQIELIITLAMKKLKSHSNSLVDKGFVERKIIAKTMSGTLVFKSFNPA